MGKILCIGDLHGRDVWKTFADIGMLLNADEDAAGFGAFEPDYDKYVFIGDYCDSFDYENVIIKHNLLEVIRFKRLYPDHVVLLWGNHELHYALDPPFSRNSKYVCSGHRPEAHFDLYNIFRENYNLFNLAFQIDTNLFTHAGVHKGWYEFRFVPEYKELEKYLNELGIEYKNDTLSDKLNTAFKHDMECIFDVGHRRGGYCKVGGPLWLDKELANKPLEGYNQVVGHTATKNIHTLNIDKDTSITFIDVLHKKKAFYTVNFKSNNP